MFRHPNSPLVARPAANRPTLSRCHLNTKTTISLSQSRTAKGRFLGNVPRDGLADRTDEVDETEIGPALNVALDRIANGDHDGVVE